MSDVYGNISFNRSKDCKFDLEPICDFLNQFLWDADGGFWEVVGDRLIFEPDEKDVLYPCLHFQPRPLKDDLEEEEDDNCNNNQEDDWALDRFVAAMQKLIGKGKVSMVCHGYWRSFPVTTTIFTFDSSANYRYHKITHYDKNDVFELIESS